jgi:hypothetical protein
MKTRAGWKETSLQENQWPGWRPDQIEAPSIPELAKVLAFVIHKGCLEDQSAS